MYLIHKTSRVKPRVYIFALGVQLYDLVWNFSLPEVTNLFMFFFG